MQSKFVTDYVQKRINEARQEMAIDASKKATVPTMNETQLDQLADRIISRVLAASGQDTAGRYTGRPESSKPGYQGQYADELLRQSGIYEREWKRLHGNS